MTMYFGRVGSPSLYRTDGKGVHYIGVHYIGVHYIGVHYIGVHYIGVHYIGVHYIGVHHSLCFCQSRFLTMKEALM